jgi:3'-5' exoribonuclease
MKSIYVSDLRPNEDVTTTFLVQAKDVRLKKTGEPFLSLTLVDKTGDIDAKMWDNVVEVVDTFDRDDFVKVKGRVQVYQNKPQITVHRLARLDDGQVDFADFFPASSRDPEEMFAELRGVVQSVHSQHLRRLLEALLDDPVIAAGYKRAPAAKSVHHAYLGGLLEHVLSLCRLAVTAAAHYPFVDLDLLIAGAVIHDIGKIDELSYQRSFRYTDEGQLLGHIVIGLRMMDDKLRGLPDFPPRLRVLVEHIVLSHHGSLEFGSPKVPLFPEALLFHFLDNIDSKMENMRFMLARDTHMEGAWTGYSPALERFLLKKDKFLAGVPEDETGLPNESAAPPAAGGDSGPNTRADGGARPPRGAPPVDRRSQQSLFGEKLKEALGGQD